MRHNFQNVDNVPGRPLVITSPSGLERFFEQWAALLPGPVGSGGDRRGRAGQLREFNGPPLAMSDPL